MVVYLVIPALGLEAERWQVPGQPGLHIVQVKIKQKYTFYDLNFFKIHICMHGQKTKGKLA
jgi:hypothetical protein